MAGSLSNTAAPIKSSLAKLQALNGLFAIYKKQGPTSADVLNTLKDTLLREAGVENSNSRKRKKQWLKMGHGGTLDSAASGVLVVGVGNGTKQLSTMLTGSKKYRAVGELGKATDTLDATGTVIMEKEFEHVTRLDMEEKLKMFTGDIMQVPPLYSALKKDGQRLSVLLKKGHQVEAKPARPVTVYSLTLQEFQPPCFTLDIECGGGFYVRSLVDDLGKALASCAHVKELIRTKQGQFTLQDHALHEEQWTLENIRGALHHCTEGDQRSDSPKSSQTGAQQLPGEKRKSSAP
ncbi:probable tRNA pseudouridine synthase 1 [Fundulus heteroclitus]|uniref:probable tRNA pseudouridine synthase 1 n=1 Tax=Fundulus heteroclitus TaxID=8078 RepID=UPI00165A6BCF|nr:probable tRNA pseudouridine synthase 1 [Fundulus heteroclitus]